MTYSGMDWFQELMDCLIYDGFRQNTMCPCFFWDKAYTNGLIIKLLKIASIIHCSLDQRLSLKMI